MPEKYRPCKAIMREWNKEKRQYDITEIEGYFHQWGSVSTEGDNHVATDSMAIIETKEGKIVTAWPNDVTFTDEKVKK